MTQEDKQLLLKDLSARFTYDIIVSVTDGTIKYNAYIESVSYKYIQVSPVDSDSIFTAYTFYKISEIKPYLRPMSSMTEEEAKEIAILDDIQVKDILSIKITDEYIDFVVDDGLVNTEIKRFWYDEIVSSIKIFDWLNSHDFDYRGLIEKGLAIEAPDGMYKF
jgi:hypothetical protein